MQLVNQKSHQGGEDWHKNRRGKINWIIKMFISETKSKPDSINFLCPRNQHTPYIRKDLEEIIVSKWSEPNFMKTECKKFTGECLNVCVFAKCCFWMKQKRMKNTRSISAHQAFQASIKHKKLELKHKKIIFDSLHKKRKREREK